MARNARLLGQRALRGKAEGRYWAKILAAGRGFRIATTNHGGNGLVAFAMAGSDWVLPGILACPRFKIGQGAKGFAASLLSRFSPFQAAGTGFGFDFACAKTDTRHQ